ncbi:MAG: hypothetical protein ACYDAO_10495 [Thermoplasmataceae archaeon]
MMLLFILTSGKPFKCERKFVASGFLIEEEGAFQISDAIKEIKLLDPLLGGSQLRITGSDIVHGKNVFFRMPIQDRISLLHRLLYVVKDFDMKILFSEIDLKGDLPFKSRVENANFIENLAIREILKRSYFAAKALGVREFRILLDDSQWVHHSNPDDDITSKIDNLLCREIDSLQIISLDHGQTAFTSNRKFEFLDLTNIMTYIFRLQTYGRTEVNHFPVKLFYRSFEDKIYSGLRKRDPAMGVFQWKSGDRATDHTSP